MTHLNGEIRFYNGRHRFFPYSQSLSTLISAVAISTCVLQHGNMTLNIGDNASFGSVQFPVDVKVPICGPIQLAIQGTEPNSTCVGIDPAPNWIASSGQPHLGMAQTCLYAVNPIFVEYFEAFRVWIDLNITSDSYQWPAPWNFARVVRNAIVHNRGHVFWDDPKPSKLPASWYGLTYSHATNKRHIIGPDLTVADLVILMLEMNEALDRAGCPN